MNIRDEIKAFVDRELEAEALAKAEREIDSNPELAEQAAFYRLLGDEIRELATEPRVEGAEQVLQRARARKRFSILVPIATVLGSLVIAAMIFPVFAQAKNASKSSWAAFRLRNADEASAASIPASGTVQLQANAPMAAAKALKMPDMGRFMTGQGRAIRGGPAMKVDNLNDTDRVDAGESPVNGSPATVTQGYAGRPDHQPAPAPQSPAFKPAVPAPHDSRMVVQNGNLDIAVADVSRAQSESMSYTRSIGGFVASSSLSKDADNASTASLTLRIPVARFEMAMDHLKSLAAAKEDVKSVNVSGDDVTAQYADTTARMKVMRAEEEDYVMMLRSARHLGDIMDIKDHLTQIREQIESLESQAAALKDTSSLSTIEMTIEQKVKAQAVVPPSDPKTWSTEAWGNAFDGLKSAGQTIGTVGIFLFVYAPIWIPLGFLAWLFARRLG